MSATTLTIAAAMLAALTAAHNAVAPAPFRVQVAATAQGATHAETNDTAEQAGTAQAGAVTIEGAYVRASIGRAPNSSAYLTLNATAADRLVAAATPAAEKAELHTHLMDDKGVMKMRPVEAIDVAPGAATALKPGGMHIMLFGVKEPLRDGTAIALTLTFEKAGPITLQVPVRGMAGMGDDAKKDGHSVGGTH